METASNKTRLLFVDISVIKLDKALVLCTIVALGYQAHFVLTLIALCNNAYRTF